MRKFDSFHWYIKIIMNRCSNMNPNGTTDVKLLLLLLLECFTPALADGLSLESEWLQVSSGLQDSSQYSDRPQQCYSLYGLGSSFDF